MVIIQGLSGVPEPKSEKTSRVRNDRDTASRDTSAAGTESAESSAKDDVSISLQAKAAAEIGRVMQLTKTQDEIRTERVAAAKERIERGEYKNPEVVAKVAERLLKYLG